MEADLVNMVGGYSATFVIILLVGIYFFIRKEKLTVPEAIWVYCLVVKLKKGIKTGDVTVTLKSFSSTDYMCTISGPSLDLHIDYRYSNGKMRVLTLILPPDVGDILSKHNTETIVHSVVKYIKPTVKKVG